MAFSCILLVVFYDEKVCFFLKVLSFCNGFCSGKLTVLSEALEKSIKIVIKGISEPHNDASRCVNSKIFNYSSKIPTKSHRNSISGVFPGNGDEIKRNRKNRILVD